jgi:hypothetical protein
MSLEAAVSQVVVRVGDAKIAVFEKNTQNQFKKEYASVIAKKIMQSELQKHCASVLALCECKVNCKNRLNTPPQTSTIPHAPPH